MKAWDVSRVRHKLIINLGIISLFKSYQLFVTYLPSISWIEQTIKTCQSFKDGKVSSLPNIYVRYYIKDFEVKSDFVFIKEIQLFQLFCNRPKAYEILLFNGMVYFHNLKEIFNNFVLGSCFLFYFSP